MDLVELSRAERLAFVYTNEMGRSYLVPSVAATSTWKGGNEASFLSLASSTPSFSACSFVKGRKYSTCGFSEMFSITTLTVFLEKLFSKLTTRTKLTFLKFCGGVNVDGNIFVDVSGFCTLENTLPAKERTAVASDNTFMLTILIDVPFYDSGQISVKGGQLLLIELNRTRQSLCRGARVFQGVLTLAAFTRVLELSRLRRLAASWGVKMGTVGAATVPGGIFWVALAT